VLLIKNRLQEIIEKEGVTQASPCTANKKIKRIDKQSVQEKT